MIRSTDADDDWENTFTTATGHEWANFDDYKGLSLEAGTSIYPGNDPTIPTEGSCGPGFNYQSEGAPTTGYVESPPDDGSADLEWVLFSLEKYASKLHLKNVLFY